MTWYRCATPHWCASHAGRPAAWAHGPGVWDAASQTVARGGTRLTGEAHTRPRRWASTASVPVELQFGEVRPVQTHDDRHRFGEPPASGRARDTEFRCDGDIPGAANQISQSVVIASLRADPARHADDHQLARSCPSAPPSAYTERSATVAMGVGIGDDNSRRQVRNVRGNSSAIGLRPASEHCAQSTGGLNFVCRQ